MRRKAFCIVENGAIDSQVCQPEVLKPMVTQFVDKDERIMVNSDTSTSRTLNRRSGFQLIIERGESRFPQRPISSDRFLIGAGSNCQLQLGGEIPLLHSIIIPDGDSLWIDAVSPHPPLIVNGQQIRDGQLNVGDVVQIGEFIFTVARRTVEEVQPEPAPTVALSDLTTERLLDLLTEDLARLNHFEASQREAARALLEAAGTSTRLPEIDWQNDPRGRLLEMLNELHERAKALNVREAALSEHAQQLERSQDELRAQIEELNRRAEAAIKNSDSAFRKSA